MKYIFKDEFKSMKYARFPFNLFFIYNGNFFMSLIPKGMKSDKTHEIEKIKLNNFNLFLIKPRNTNPKKCIIFYHGGGFVFKAVYHYKIAKAMAISNNALVVFVDYRMCYNHEYNTSVNDAFDAYKWVLANSTKLKINLNDINLFGDSAGGFLCLKVSKLANDNKLIMPKTQMLIYPVVDVKMRSESMKKFYNTPLWNSKNNRKMWKLYLKNNQEESFLDMNLAYMPKTYIEVAEYDCLRDEGYLLNDLLKNCNVMSQITLVNNSAHGYDVYTKSKTLKELNKKRTEFFKE